MKIIQDSQKVLKVTDGWWCGRFHPPQKTQIVTSEIQGLSIFVNDQEAKLDDWIDQTAERLHDTFFSETADSFYRILDFGAHWAFVWRWDRVTPLGWRCARKWWPTTASSEGFHAHPRFFEAIETWNRQNPAQITFFFEAFFFVLNQRWCEQWKKRAKGCFGLYRGGTFWLYPDVHGKWKTV